LDWDFTVLATKGNCELLPVTKPGVRVIRYTPHANLSGSDSFTLRVIDDDVNPQKRGQDQLKVNVTISPVNDLPIIQAPPAFQISGGTTSSFEVVVADEETLPDDLVVTCSASGLLLPAGSVTLQGSGSTRTVRLSPSSTSKISSGKITLAVTDNSRKTTRTTVSLSILP
jgi:hypothetical protein